MSRSIVVRGIRKSYFAHDNVVNAVDDLSLDVAPGRTLVLLGPSGCGKTTLLRSVAGLEQPDSGQIMIGDQVVFSSDRSINLPPERRDVGMVFQSYALWPHLSVMANVLYPLKVRAKSPGNAGDLARAALAKVGCEALEKRYPNELSGGQQQRVALARALVSEPGVVLMDEPLSNLDAKLRERLRFELRELTKELEMTVLYVTHDQEEAMTLGDEIAVMNHGRVEQLGQPRDVYETPMSMFVADFVGSMNVLNGDCVGTDDAGRVTVQTPGGLVDGLPIDPISVGQKVMACFRPHDVMIVEPDAEPGTVAGSLINGTLNGSAYLGYQITHEVAVGDSVVNVWASPGAEPLDPGSPVVLVIAPGSCRVFREQVLDD